MVAGHLQIKKGHYYMVLNLKDERGKRKQKWISTGISVGTKRNEKQAENMLLETRTNYKEPIIRVNEIDGVRLTNTMLFADYMLCWLSIIKNTVESTTYAGYESSIKQRIAPYFRKLGVSLGDLNALDIEGFYGYCSSHLNLKGATIRHYHANIHKALKYAVRHDLIATSPMEKVDRPKCQPYTASFYSATELERLFHVAKDDPLEFPILMFAFYGLRRSEVMGLRWQSVDFEANTISIEHTVVQVHSEGEMKIIQKDRTKTKSSCRTMPMVSRFRELLLQMKQEQETNRKVCGNAYMKNDYIFVNALGVPYKPDYVTQHFRILLQRNGLRPIRFHDLRHSCASLLLKNGMSMKEIQEWLGHSNYSTTANCYAHLDSTSKNHCAEKLSAVLFSVGN